jgi:hypothetical protein
MPQNVEIIAAEERGLIDIFLASFLHVRAITTS